MPIAIATSDALSALGLRRCEPIRFKRREGRRWQVGTVRRVETDGSITLHDADGAARSHFADTVMVRRPGARGRLTWQYVSTVAVTWEQLCLFDDVAGSDDPG